MQFSILPACSLSLSLSSCLLLHYVYVVQRKSCLRCAVCRVNDMEIRIDSLEQMNNWLVQISCGALRALNFQFRFTGRIGHGTARDTYPNHFVNLFRRIKTVYTHSGITNITICIRCIGVSFDGGKKLSPAVYRWRQLNEQLKSDGICVHTVAHERIDGTFVLCAIKKSF